MGKPKPPAPEPAPLDKVLAAQLRELTDQDLQLDVKEAQRLADLDKRAN